MFGTEGNGERSEARQDSADQHGCRAAGEWGVRGYIPSASIVSARNARREERMTSSLGRIEVSSLPEEWHPVQWTGFALEDLHGGPLTIVETGTAETTWSSTFAWAIFVVMMGGRVYSVDADPDRLCSARCSTRGYWFVDFIQDEPQKFLGRWRHEHPDETIHLLYLDSVESHGPDRIDARHVEEALAAAPAMAERGLVLFREATGYEGPGSEGQAGRAARYLSERGFEVLWTKDRWVLLVWNPGSP